MRWKYLPFLFLLKPVFIILYVIIYDWLLRVESEKIINW